MWKNLLITKEARASIVFLNGQLKPGYNLQLATNNQVIVNYTLHSTPTDTLTLKPHLLEYEAL